MRLLGDRLPARIVRLSVAYANAGGYCILAASNVGVVWRLGCRMRVRSIEANSGRGSASQSMHGVAVEFSPDRGSECGSRMLRIHKCLSPTPHASTPLCSVRLERSHEALCVIAATKERGGQVCLHPVEECGAADYLGVCYRQYYSSWRST